MIKKRSFIYLFFIIFVFFRTGFLRANYFHNYIYKFEGLFIADLSDQFKKQQANLWNDYNKCVDIYNSADYLYIGDFTNSRILLRNENGNEVIYKVKIDENLLENTEINDQLYSFEQKCFKKVDFELWKVVIGQTYRFRGRPGGPEGAIQYKWKDNSKNELITYRKVPYEPIIQEVLVKKCPIKVKQIDLYKLDSYGRYTKERDPGKRQQYIDSYGGICMDYQKKGESENINNKELINKNYIDETIESKKSEQRYFENYKNKLKSQNLLENYLELGIEKIQKQKYNAAIIDLNKAIRNKPSSKEAYYSRGYAKIQIRDFIGAILDFDKVIELDPSFEKAYDHRGYAKFFLGDYYGVKIDYDKAINLNPNDPLYFFKRGSVKERLGDIKGACSDAKRSIALGYIDEANKKWVADMCN